jgi:hypothetical protein
VPLRICLEPLLSFDSAINLSGRHYILFHDAVRNHRGHLPVEEVQYPVMHSPKADPQFINAVAQEVCLRSLQFVALSLSRSSRRKHLSWILTDNPLNPLDERAWYRAL